MSLFPPDVIAAAQASEKLYRPLGPFVSVSLAQWALESAYGRDEPAGSNNPFGIKAVAGRANVVAWTHETLQGRYVEIPQHFAKYDSLTDAFDAHAKLLATSPIYKICQEATTVAEYCMGLQGRYATGIPGHPYGTTLLAIIHAANLTQYDLEPAIPAATVHGP